MMDTEFNIELVQEPGNSAMSSILDLVETVKKAWTQLPGIKILETFEWRRNVVHKAQDTDGLLYTSDAADE